MGGALLIVISIVVAKLGDLLSEDGGNKIPALAILFAVVSSFNSVGAAVYTEQLFKAGGENFLEQQFWLYGYGMLVAAGVHVVTSPDTVPATALASLTTASPRVQVTGATIVAGAGNCVV